MTDISTILKFLVRLSHLYEGRFLRPLWSSYPDRETDDWDALAVFLAGYAFARQGAPNEFIHAACDAIQQLKESGATLVGRNVATKAWVAFSTLLKNADLNYANNPLCPKETQYTRKFKGASRTARTSRLSVIEFLATIQPESRAANIILYAKRNLEGGNLSGVHQALSGRGGINGIGGKIASFFLRDVATFYHIWPTKDHHLLQPVDVWVRSMSAELIGVQTSDEEVARWIVREAAAIAVNAEAVNQGMWYFGSQIGESGYRVLRALEDLEYAKTLLNEHMEALRLELLAWEQDIGGTSKDRPSFAL